MKVDIEKFFDELHADIAGGKFHKPSPEEDAMLDRLFAMMKPHFEAALEDAVRRGVLVRREDV